MTRTVRVRAQESKGDGRQGARQGCKGSRMLLHPGNGDDDGEDDEDEDENGDEVEDYDLDNYDGDHSQNTPC